MMENREICLWLERARACFDGTPWYGPALWNVLEKVDSTQADLIPQGASNSIAALVNHLAAWHEFAIKKIAGDTNFDITLNSPADWPPSLVRNQQDWKALKSLIVSKQNELAKSLGEKTDEWLDTTVPGRNYSFRYLLEGIIQHNVYHLGQITLVWKLVKAENGN